MCLCCGLFVADCPDGLCLCCCEHCTDVLIRADHPIRTSSYVGS
jgi:hypothetical protein